MIFDRLWGFGVVMFDRLIGFVDNIRSVVGGVGRVRLRLLELFEIDPINPPLRICVGGRLVLIVFICVPIAGIIDNILSDMLQF
jgi:hypothetical protein